MRRLFLALALLLLPALVAAQDIQRFSPFAAFWYNGSGYVAPGPLLLPDGSVSAPSFAPASAPTTGFYWESAGFTYAIGATRYLFMNSAGFMIRSNGALSWSTNPTQVAADLFLTRSAAGVLQQGNLDAAAPANQTLQAQGVVAGTSDVAGGSYTIRPGVGRGSAVPGALTLNRSLVTTTGNSAQAQSSGMVICGTKTMSTTTSQAQTVVTITTTTLSAGGVTVFYNVAATSASAADAATGAAHVSWNNVGATVNATMGTVINEVQSNSSGTLAATPTVTVATNVVSIKLTPTWVTIVPTAVRAAVTVLNQGIDPIACQ